MLTGHTHAHRTHSPSSSYHNQTQPRKGKGCCKQTCMHQQQQLNRQGDHFSPDTLLTTVTWQCHNMLGIQGAADGTHLRVLYTRASFTAAVSSLAAIWSGSICPDREGSTCTQQQKHKPSASPYNTRTHTHHGHRCNNSCRQPPCDARSYASAKDALKCSNQTAEQPDNTKTSQIACGCSPASMRLTPRCQGEKLFLPRTDS